MVPIRVVRVLALTAGMALLTGCDRSVTITLKPEAVDPTEAVRTAKETAMEAFGLLSGELGTAISEGGVASAVPVCADRAPVILQELSEKKGVGIVRWSDKPRNEAHAAEGVDREVIGLFREERAAGNALVPDVRTTLAREVEVRLPIILENPLCLKCHGGEEEVAEETRAAIRKAYPLDKATGYQLNELRGIWRITFAPAWRQQ